jgi:hypothetical protein
METSQDMGAEEAQRLLAQVQLRCLFLEADKEAECLRAVKYRNLLDTLAREDNSGATQPEASRVVRAARSALAPPALPAPTVCCPDLHRGGVFMLTWMAPSHHRIQKCQP